MFMSGPHFARIAARSREEAHAIGLGDSRIRHWIKDVQGEHAPQYTSFEAGVQAVDAPWPDM